MSPINFFKERFEEVLSFCINSAENIANQEEGKDTSVNAKEPNTCQECKGPVNNKFGDRNIFSHESQFQNKNWVNIVGIDYTHENIMVIILKIFSKIGFPQTKDCLDSFYRIKTRDGKMTNILRIKFKNRSDKEWFKYKAKENREILNMYDLNISEDPADKIRKIYINEPMSAESRYLFRKCKLLQKEGKIEFILVSNGTIFAKKNKNSLQVRISKESDINQLESDSKKEIVTIRRNSSENLSSCIEIEESERTEDIVQLIMLLMAL